MSNTPHLTPRKGGNIPLLATEEEKSKFPLPGSPSSRQQLMSTLEEFTRLYRDSKGTEEDSQQLLLSVDRLDCSLFYAMPLEKDPELERSLFKVGIHDLLQDIIMDDGFFHRSLVG